jgi:hypothetical protein
MSVREIKFPQWRGRFYIRVFSVSPDSDITDTMREKISAGFLRIGFQPKKIEKVPEKTLRVEIARLKATIMRNSLL